jgi:formylglycine-generating enzyme required for sulfatase activity
MEKTLESNRKKADAANSVASGQDMPISGSGAKSDFNNEHTPVTDLDKRKRVTKWLLGIAFILLLGVIIFLIPIPDKKKETFPEPPRPQPSVKESTEKQVLKEQQLPVTTITEEEESYPKEPATVDSDSLDEKTPDMDHDIQEPALVTIRISKSNTGNQAKETRVETAPEEPIKSSDMIEEIPEEPIIAKAIPEIKTPEEPKTGNSLGMEFVYIPSGTFMMGTPPKMAVRDTDERYHKVTLTKDFFMQTTEVTRKQWAALMGKTQTLFPKTPFFEQCGDDCPIENISWNDVQEFVRRLNEQENTDKYRLPTEAEWEYACRAGSGAYFCFGYDFGELGAYAWYKKNSKRQVHKVGRKKPNAWGLYDMHGNVWEWCSDLKGRYSAAPAIDPTGPKEGSRHVCRGGSWRNFDGGVRSAYRDYIADDRGDNFLGFRLVRMP